jgi:hypothetical protein
MSQLKAEGTRRRRLIVGTGLIAGAALALAALATSSSAAAALGLGRNVWAPTSDVARSEAATQTTASSAHPDCPSGQIAQMQFATHPDVGTRGARTPEDALRTAYPAVGTFTMDPFSTSISKAPIWIVADGKTFVATIMPDGGWFVSPVTFVGCHAPQPGPRGPAPAQGSGPVG